MRMLHEGFDSLISINLFNQKENKMIKSKSEMPSGIEIDLTGPEGNAYALMGYAGRFCKQLGLNKEEVIAEMMMGDYENLLDVFEKNFGHFVTMYR